MVMTTKYLEDNLEKKNHNSQFREQVIRGINTLSPEDEHEMMEDDRNFEKSLIKILKAC